MWLRHHPLKIFSNLILWSVIGTRIVAFNVSAAFNFILNHFAATDNIKGLLVSTSWSKINVSPPVSINDTSGLSMILLLTQLVVYIS